MNRERIFFEKYQGTGNDFILIDDRQGHFPSVDSSLVKKLCARHYGVGSDGLILIRKSFHLDFHMDFFNPDGSTSFCGNGSRCAVLFARSLGMFQGEKCKFSAIDGQHEALVLDQEIRVKMRDVGNCVVDGNEIEIFTGSPHFLSFGSTLPVGDIRGSAREIRYSEKYAEKGINVNFVAPDARGIAMRTYERGVEDETLSCGTGVTAAALGAALKYALTSPIHVSTAGGLLKVHFAMSGQSSFRDIWLEGPAIKVFEGSITLSV
jgi:diaminopimelate epimerase